MAQLAAAADLRKYFAEAFGTFCLVFAGTGAVVIDGATRGGVTHVGVALIFAAAEPIDAAYR